MNIANQQSPPIASGLDAAQRLNELVFTPMKNAFVGKNEVVDLLGVCLVARENLFILGPPGTAKSALVHDLAKRIEGQVFDYLLTRFTEPGEIFGPFDIRQLREGNLVTNTEGMLPEATFVFLDELLNANSAILNSLLMVLNERVFRRGRETRSLPTLMVVGASNHLPEEDALQALFDRFLLRVNCTNVPDDSLPEVLLAGWRLENREPLEHSVSIDEIKSIQRLVEQVDLSQVTDPYVQTIRSLRTAGIAVSDRRAVKLQRMMAASSILCGRMVADPSDMWVLRYIWDSVEQQEILNSLVNTAIESNEDSGVVQHVQAHPNMPPDPEALAMDIESLKQRYHEGGNDEVEQALVRERLMILARQVQWISNEQQRQHLQALIRSVDVEEAES